AITNPGFLAIPLFRTGDTLRCEPPLQKDFGMPEVTPDLSIVVPLYEEEENVPLLIDALAAALEPKGYAYEIICVNDGSRDGTSRILNERAVADRRLKVIEFRRNFGQTAALMAGLDAASGAIIVTMDGDLQNDPEDIPNLIAKLEEGYDVVSGWRRDRKDNALVRNFPSRIANWLISRASGIHLHDYGCTLKAYRAEVIKNVNLYGEMHRFIPVYASWIGANITEIEVRHHARRFGQSKYGLNRIFKVILDLAVIQFMGNYRTKPIHVFGAMGLISLLLSFLAFAWALGLKFTGTSSLIQTPLPLLSVFLFSLGVTFIFLGLLAELLVRVYYEVQDKPIYHIRHKVNLDRPADTDRTQKS
ncbi:MAG: glycosyltransferase family 2 protein, partial [Rhodospirillales bacterium]